MTVEISESVRKLLQSIANIEDIYNYKIHTSSACSKGDGYSGSLLSIKLENDKNTLYFILKTPEPTTRTLLKIFRRKSYLREIYVYNNVLQKFQIFQRAHNVYSGFIGFAQIYGSSDTENKEYLLLEDLKQNGYQLWDRKIPMPDEHVALVFSEYGKFHAISLAMKDKLPEVYYELAEHLGDFYMSSLSGDVASETIQNILKIGFKVVESKGAVEKIFKRFSDGIEKFLMVDLEATEDKLVVIHGDSWCNNFMFKYEDNKLKNVCFIDWQLSKMGSPVLDLAYFFFVCSPADNLHNFKNFLKIYHNSVTETLQKFRCDGNLFPYNLLKYHWNKYSKYGLYAALMTIDIMFYENSEASKETYQNGRINNVKNQRIVDIINIMAQNNLI